MLFLHVHHLTPLSSIGKKHQVDPREDLHPVCPNCHEMLHRQTPALSIDELRSKISKQTISCLNSQPLRG
jgi:5-methylcytosine-specific restriction protein A